MPALPDGLVERVANARVAFPAVGAVLLHGSRARAEPRSDSDWDLALLPLEPGGLSSVAWLALQAALAEAVNSDKVGLSMLDRAGAVLRFRVADEGLVLFERTPAIVLAFRLEAIRFWCEAALVIRQAQEELLEDLVRRAAA